MWRVIVTFICAALVIYLSYVFSKYVGKGLSKGSRSNYMRVIDQIIVGQDRQIAIIQVGMKYLLAGITAGQINILMELKEEDLLLLSVDSEDSSPNVKNFKEMIEKIGDFRKKGGKG